MVNSIQPVRDKYSGDAINTIVWIVAGAWIKEKNALIWKGKQEKDKKKQARKTKKTVKAMWNHIWKICETLFHFDAFTLNLEGFEADFRE